MVDHSLLRVSFCSCRRGHGTGAKHRITTQARRCSQKISRRAESCESNQHAYLGQSIINTTMPVMQSIVEPTQSTWHSCIRVPLGVLHLGSRELLIAPRWIDELPIEQASIAFSINSRPVPTSEYLVRNQMMRLLENCAG